MSLAELNDIINKSKNILIVSHINPDGDTLGSMCAMYGLIKENYKKTPKMLAISHIPKNYDFLPFSKEIKFLKDYDKSMVYDLVIAVDVAALDRIGDAQIFFEKAVHTVNIDHHKTNNNYGDLAFVEGDASSAGEVVYKVAEQMNLKFTKDIAICLYTSLLTDTGGFRFDNTTAVCLNVASKLVELGAKPLDIYKKCYENKSKGLVMFQNYCINKAQFMDDDKIAYVVIYKKDLEKFAALENFTDGIAETLRSIDTTEVSFVLKEIDNRVFKASMRSKKIDIARVCEEFSGGGHKFAAGCTLRTSADEAVKKIINQIYKQV